MMSSLEVIAKRVFTYVFRRCVGNYLETFTHEELSFDYTKGKAVVENVALKVEALNTLIDDYNLPFELLSGVIDEVSIEVPWTAPLTENSLIEFRGVNLVVHPKKCADDGSMFLSMFDTMTSSSLEIAQECLTYKLKDEPEIESPAESVETIVRAINAVFAKLKIKFINAVIRIESILDDGITGIALEIRIQSANYFDEAGVDTSSNRNVNSSERNMYQSSAYTVKKCLFEGISLYTEQFNASVRDTNPECSSVGNLSPGSPEMPPQHASSIMCKEEKVIAMEPVLISKILGQQQLRLKLKQNENIIGPKVDIEINLGALNLFLSPYQLFLLIELANGMTKPGSASKNSSNTGLKTTNNRPMRDIDYALIEQELHRQNVKLNMPSKALHHQQGWSSQSIYEPDEEFHLMKVESKATEIPLITEDLESSCSSSMYSEKMFMAQSANMSDTSSSRRSSRSRVSTIQALLTDPLIDSTQIHLSCSTFTIVLLHDHRWTEDSSKINSNNGFDAKDLMNFTALRILSKEYFDQLTALSMEGLNFKDFSAIRDKVSRLTKASHLRFVSSGLTLDINEKTSSAQRMFTTALILLDLEILECLFNTSIHSPTGIPAHMAILSFNHERLQSITHTNELAKEPCLRIKYDQYDNGVQLRALKHLPNKLFVQMAPVALDVDISLENRIQSLLNRDITFPNKNKKVESHWRDDESSMDGNSPLKTEIKFQSSFALVNLRFPVPDLRDFIDRTPWWKQTLRDESLIMELTDASLSFVVNSEYLDQEIELQCKDFHGLLKVLPNEMPISFIRVSADPKADQDGLDWPRLVIRTIPQVSSLYMDADPYDHDDPYFSSCLNQESTVQSLIKNMQKDPSPFSNTSVAFGSKIPGEKDEEVLYDEIVTPADKANISSFIDTIVSQSQYVFDFHLPTVNIILPDRDFFELLYNRLGSDLIIWEPAPVIPVNTYDPSIPTQSIMDYNVHPLNNNKCYKSFNSQDDCNSDSDEEMITFQSTKDHALKRNEKKMEFVDNNYKLTKLSVNMNIVKGSLTMHCPLIDADKSISADSCGRLQLCVEDCKFFIASSYKGNPMESYICLLSNRAYLYHDSIFPLATENCIVQPFVNRNAESSNLIIYPSEKGVPLKPGVTVGHGENSMDVLSISVQIRANPKQRIKTFKLAIGVTGATLRHYMNISSHLWLNQFTDFVVVEDHPILGYIPSSVVTQLHVHLMHCSIDYRPLYLPLKTFFSFENFNLSTNITSSTNSSLLRIISEELLLFLSNDMKPKAVDLRKDYVCVMATGLIDLSVRVTSSSNSESPPKAEICVSNNMINIHTCSDSCQALQKFIIYLAGYGDFVSASTPTDDENENFEEDTTPVADVSPPSIPNVHNLMAEAMKDCSLPKHESIKNENSDSDLNDSDESFCIIEDDVGVGILPKNSEPQIKKLTTEQIKIDYEYFKVPIGKSDLLKAPKHFPEAVLRQTLREMSITWHLYGGNDFKSTKKVEKKRVRCNSNPESRDSSLNSVNSDDCGSIRINNKDKISFCKVTPLSQEFNINAIHYSIEQITIDQSARENAVRSWILKGGEGRDRDILIELQLSKIRYQHEEYPESSEFVSRDVLIIHDIEIRDKLVDSNFNKFLYQFSSESMPRQTHANMFVIKAVKIRPDPKQPSEECSLKISCKPLRLNVDQDALMFLLDFFKVVLDEPDINPPNNVSPKEEQIEIEAQSVSPSAKPLSPTSPTTPTFCQSDSSPIFFRSFTFAPRVLIRFDYKGKRVDMEQGTLPGILMGFGQLNCSEITLKQLSYRHGLLGWEKLLSFAFNEWFQDIKKNQLHGVLGGVGPMHSIVQLFQGVKDFVWFPVAQYRKDGQIVRGLQRGASSFSTSTAAAVLELTSQFVGLIQGAAVYAYDMVSPGPSVVYKLQGNTNDLRRPSQPADIREGVTSAYNVVKEGLSGKARRIVQIASAEHEHKGLHGAVGSIVRQMPGAAMAPIVLGAEAAIIMIDGAKHQLVPDAHKEAVDKWRTKDNA